MKNTNINEFEVIQPLLRFSYHWKSFPCTHITFDVFNSLAPMGANIWRYGKGSGEFEYMKPTRNNTLHLNHIREKLWDMEK